jgi:RNA polymerase sigma-70 factor (ECF subfamily)
MSDSHARTPDPLEFSLPAETPPPPCESIELVLRHKRGDPAALDLLLRRYQARLRRIVRIRLDSNLREHLESMDIVQSVHVFVARKLGEIEPLDEASLLKWLAQIVEDQIRDAGELWSTMKRRPEGKPRRIDAIESSTAGTGFAIAADDALPTEAALRAEFREILDDSVAKLPEEYRDVILSRDYCGESWEAVAESLDRPSVGAARELHRRAWIRLRRIARPRLTGLL